MVPITSVDDLAAQAVPADCRRSLRAMGLGRDTHAALRADVRLPMATESRRPVPAGRVRQRRDDRSRKTWKFATPPQGHEYLSHSSTPTARDSSCSSSSTSGLTLRPCADIKSSGGSGELRTRLATEQEIAATRSSASSSIRRAGRWLAFRAVTETARTRLRSRRTSSTYRLPGHSFGRRPAHDRRPAGLRLPPYGPSESGAQVRLQRRQSLHAVRPVDHHVLYPVVMQTPSKSRSSRRARVPGMKVASTDR